MSFRVARSTPSLPACRALFASALALLCGCGGSIQSLVAPAASTPVSAPAAVKSGPQLGYLWSDQAQTLRPVLGIPGSSQLGQSVVAEKLYAGAAASNLSNLALLQEHDGSLDLMSLPSGQPVRLAASAAPGAQLRFAPSGLAAIAFVPGQDTVLVLTNLLATPKITTITFAQELSEAAVSDSGSLAAALPSTSGTAIRTISLAGAPNQAAFVRSLGGIAFAGTGEGLLVADASTNTLTMVQASTSFPSATVLAGADLLNAPLAVGASHDGRWAVLANAADANIVRVDLTGQSAPQRFACDCQPTLAAPLSGAGVFRITSANSGPTWIFDAAAAKPRILFIPASDSAAATKAGSN